MRKLIMWNLMTVDGYFEGSEPWSLDFHETVWGDELERISIEQLDAAGSRRQQRSRRLCPDPGAGT